MSENILVRLIEHNNWANLQILDACEALSEDSLTFNLNLQYVEPSERLYNILYYLKKTTRR